MILFDKTDAGSLVPTLAVLGTKGKIIARIVGEHTKPKTLRPAVAVNERMTRVDLVDVSRGLCREVALAPAYQIPGAGKVFEQRFHPTGDVRRNRKWHSAPAGRVIPFLPRPTIKVLEKVAMYRLETRVSSIVGADRKAFVGTVFGYACSVASRIVRSRIPSLLI